MDILVTDNEQAQAIERVCDKRYLRGATPRQVIKYLDGLYERQKNKALRAEISKLTAYWFARMA